MTTENQIIKIIECPRDAMQGLSVFIDTATKADYINQLLKVGFDTIDFGSFVSPKAVPQMQDTAAVLEKLDLKDSSSRLLAIVANVRGAEEAANHPQIAYLGFPLSLSETFQQRNTNKSISEAFKVIEEIQSICIKSGQELVVYLSMGFGNPYGDPYTPDYVTGFVSKLSQTGIRIISLSDTVGVAVPEIIDSLFSTLIPAYPDIEFGAHFHSHPTAIKEKLEAAFKAGCRRFDSAMKGFGGCPMAKDELVGNLPTEKVIRFFEKKGIKLGINQEAFDRSVEKASFVFPLS